MGDQQLQVERKPASMSSSVKSFFSTFSNSSTEKFQICLPPNSDKRWHFPGELLQGNVELTLNGPAKTMSVTILFQGTVRTHVSKAGRTNDEKCVLFRQEILLWRAPGTGPQVLEAGKYVWPFGFEVPGGPGHALGLAGLPTELDDEECKAGSIRYHLTARHNKPMISDSLCPCVELSVHVIDHINACSKQLDIPRIEASETKVRVPRNMTLADKRVLKKNERPIVKCQVQVPQMGYLKDDIIPLKIEVFHAAPVKNLHGAGISLTKVAKFQAKGQESVITTCLFTATAPIICDPITNIAIIHKAITMPATTFPSTTNGKLIRITYLIEVVLDLSMDALVSDKTYNRKKHKEGKPIKLGKYGLAFDIPIVIATVAWNEATERDPRNLLRRSQPPSMDPYTLVRAGSAPSLMVQPRQDPNSPRTTPPPVYQPLVYRSSEALVGSRPASVIPQQFQPLPSYTAATAPTAPTAPVVYSPPWPEHTPPTAPWAPPPARGPYELEGHLGVMTHQHSVRRPSAPDINEVFSGTVEQGKEMHLGVAERTKSMRRPSAPNIGDIMAGEREMSAAFAGSEYTNGRHPAPLLQQEARNSMGGDESDEAGPKTVYYDDVDSYATGLISARRFENKEEDEDDEDYEDGGSEYQESEAPPSLFVTIPPISSPVSDDAKLAPRMVSPLSSPDEPDFPPPVPRQEVETAELPVEEGSWKQKPDEERPWEKPNEMETNLRPWEKPNQMETNLRPWEKPNEMEAKPHEFESGEAASGKEEVGLWTPPPLPPRRNIMVVPAPMPPPRPPLPPRPSVRELSKINRFSGSER